MFKTKIAIIFLLLMTGQVVVWGQEDKLKVLVIGNSLIYWNDFHAKFKSVCVQNNKQIDFKTIAYPGIELVNHFNSCPDSSAGYTVTSPCVSGKPPAIEALKSNNWDIVILQDPCRADYLFPKTIIDSVRLYGGNQCKIFVYEDFSTILYSTAKREAEATQKMNSYEISLQGVDVTFLPIGKLFHFVNTQFPKLDIFDEDYEHPNNNGSLLQLGIIYKAIYGKLPQKFNFPHKKSKTLLKILQAYESDTKQKG